MKRKTVVKVLVLGVVLAVLVGAGYYFLLASKLAPSAPVATAVDKLLGWQFPPGATKFPSTGSAAEGTLAYSDIRDPGGIPQGLPVRLKIPVIAVDSAIEDAQITPDGRMDVPAGTVNVAWFALGPHPGDVGSAVIGGHFGIQNGVKFVFYDLDKLKVGDKIYIVNDQSNTLAFMVRSIKSFDRNADATSVFTSNDGRAHLNLITCEGTWNQVNGNYPQRLVIFTDAIAPEGAAPTGVSTTLGGASGSIAAISRTLDIGASGADVVALQTVLEQRGLLELPPGVTNGLFGALTRAAVAKYQASEGLPQLGVFGPLTRGRLNSQLASKPVLPNTGTDNPQSGAELVSTSYDSFKESIKSLFATPTDALVTIVFLLAIVFLSYKIIRR